MAFPSINSTWYTISEDGKPNHDTLDAQDAALVFENPNEGNEKVLIESKVLRKKIIQRTEVELAKG